MLVRNDSKKGSIFIVTSESNHLLERSRKRLLIKLRLKHWYNYKHAPGTHGFVCRVSRRTVLQIGIEDWHGTGALTVVRLRLQLNTKTTWNMQLLSNLNSPTSFKVVFRSDKQVASRDSSENGNISKHITLNAWQRRPVNGKRLDKLKIKGCTGRGRRGLQRAGQAFSPFNTFMSIFREFLYIQRGPDVRQTKASWRRNQVA